MAPPTPHRACCAAIALSALLCLASCAVPLAPGYKIERQSITVRFIAGSPPHLAVRAEYRFANVGNANLDSIEVGLPGQKSFGLKNLRVVLDDREVAPQIARGADADEGESASSESWPVIWRIPFSPAWHRKQKRGLTITYDLTAAADPRGRMYVAPNMFFLNDSGWFPNPIAPKSLFARDLVRPNPSDLRIIVPVGFQAMGSGEPQGVKQSNAEAEYRFRIRKDDFDPFVIAGQYHVQRVTTADGAVVFWTFKPLSPAEAQSTGAQVASAASFYEQTFESLPRSMKAIYDVELPQDDSTTAKNENNDSDFSLPGVVCDWRFRPGKGFGTWLGNTLSTTFGHLALASTWFGHMIRPRPEAWALGKGLAAYASELQDQKTSARPSHEDTIVSNLQDYDDERASTVEKPILSLTPGDPENQLQIGGDKFSLFMAALEDKCGRDNLNHALAHMVSALRFQQYGYDDFRSVVEQECHQDLSSFFRIWVSEKGIPADFRAKYEPASQRKN